MGGLFAGRVLVIWFSGGEFPRTAINGKWLELSDDYPGGTFGGDFAPAMYLDVSSFAGQKVELQFSLSGGFGARIDGFAFLPHPVQILLPTPLDESIQLTWIGGAGRSNLSVPMIQLIRTGLLLARPDRIEAQT